MQARDRGFVITGAGSGLGAATARRLVRAGASVLLLDRDIAAAQALCDELGDRSIAVRADVTSAADVENALRLFREALGDLHGAVNCAGVAPAEKVLGRERPHDLDAFARTIQINLVGTFNVLRLAAAQILRWADWPGGIRRLQGRDRRHDAACCKGALARGNPGGGRGTGNHGNANAFGHAGRGAASAGTDGAFPSAIGSSGRVREPGVAHHRKPVPQRRSDSSGRCDPHGSQVTTEYLLPLTRGTKDMRREGFFE